jgi:hypothetical protein
VHHPAILFTDKQVHHPPQQQPNATIDEVSLSNETVHDALLRTNQTIGSNNKELETDSINQNQVREFILTNEQQPVDNEPMLDEQIEDF